MSKQYQTPKELEETIEEGFRTLLTDGRSEQQFIAKLRIMTAAQDYYIVTGNYYHRPIGNKTRGKING